MAGLIEYGKAIDSVRVGSQTGLVSWVLNVDREGNREYTVVFQVRSTSSNFTDGPFTIANTPGLPLIGAPWHTSRWNIGTELDLNARCTPEMKVIPVEKKAKSEFWLVELKFSTRPRERCQDARWEDPVLEPQKVSGSFVKKTIEARLDKDGDPITSSSHENLHGPAVEFDDNYPTVTVQQNVRNLELPLVASLARRTVNKSPMWGLGARTVRLANASWSRQLVGTCEYFYVRTFEFEIDYNTFDRDDIIDEGTKALGRWNPTTKVWEVPVGLDVDNPSDFERYVDKKGEIAHVLLDGLGKPLSGTADYALIPMITDKGAVKYYHDTVGGVDVDYIKLLKVPGVF